MRRAIAHLLLATGLCCAFAWAMFHYGGLAYLVFSLGIFGCLAWPIINLLAELRLAARHDVLAPLNGLHYSFQGMRIHVLEDDDYCQWVPADDVRRVLGQGASDRMLSLAYPDGWSVMGKPPQGYLRDDALVIYLAKESSLRGAKFRVWVERNIAFQADKQRKRFGIRISDPRAPDLRSEHFRDTVVPREMQSTLPL